MKRERIDKLLVERGLAPSRTRAQALVMAGVVLVDEQRVEKPSEMFEPSMRRFASRERTTRPRATSGAAA